MRNAFVPGRLAANPMEPSEHLAKRVGDTPLLKCPRLAEHLGLPNLRIKLEGTNPTGTQKDRIAHLEIQHAIADGHDAVTAGSCGNFGVAIAYACHVTKMECHIYVPEDFVGERVDLMEKLGAQVHRVPGNYEDAVDASRQHSKQNGAYDANPGGANTLHTLAGYASIAEEIANKARKRKMNIEAVGVSVGNGSTLAGVHLGFTTLWGRGELQRVPKIFGGTSRDNNPIVVAAAQDARRCTPIDPRSINETAINEPLVNWDALDGTACLTAIQDSHGDAYGITDDVMVEYAEKLKEDGFEAHPASLTAVAALKEAVEEGHVDAEAHMVAVMTSGRAQLTIDHYQERLPKKELDQFVTDLIEWLDQFGDPRSEVEEAVFKAFDEGHVLIARDREGPVGAVTLTPMPFEEFFPLYHLSYIAVSQRARGRGIGTILLEEAVRVTKGDVSLHVETNNHAAIRLYEKFGFVPKYYRMLHQGFTAQERPAEGVVAETLEDVDTDQDVVKTPRKTVVKEG